MTAFSIEPMTAVVGVEIDGIDLAAPIGDRVARSLRQALHRHGVLIFRDQNGMTRARQADFARIFGDIVRSPLGLAADPDVVEIVHDETRPPTENIWHVDHSFSPAPPRGAVLRAIELPTAGGDTLFADMRIVWRRLPEAVQTVLRGLDAVHDIAKCAPATCAAELRAAAPPTCHPVMKVHPATAEEILFVNEAYTTGFDGLDGKDGTVLLRYLLDQIRIPEVQCRLRWHPGTIAIWDNRSMQHYATSDYFPQRRVMDRVTIA